MFGITMNRNQNLKPAFVELFDKLERVTVSDLWNHFSDEELSRIAVYNRYQDRIVEFNSVQVPQANRQSRPMFVLNFEDGKLDTVSPFHPVWIRRAIKVG